MSTKRIVDDYLEDILDSIADIGEFTKGMTFEQFAQDRKTVNAVIRSLEIIGEATKKIPDSIRIEHKDEPWKEIAGMRDKLIHEYFGVDIQLVWITIQEDIVNYGITIKKLLNKSK